MSDARDASPAPRPPSLDLALLPVVAMIGLLCLNIFVFKADYHHLPLIFATVVAAAVGLGLGHPWSVLEEGMTQGIVVGLRALLILMIVGILIGTWIASGVVPLLICYGMELLNPSWFLVACCLICALVSLATGSSWTTAGTVGVALIAVGRALEVSPGMTAGAIVSGAYFGDKLSPLSDTTNLAPAVAGAELFEHIRHMVWTTIPALLIALLAYWMLGSGAGSDLAGAPPIRETIENSFRLNLLLLLPPVLVIVMVAKRVPALPALLGGAILGGLLAVGVQGVPVREVLAISLSGFEPKTGDAAVDELLARGGLLSMMPTLSLIMCALAFGGVMEAAGLLGKLSAAMLGLARSTGSLIAATVGTCLGVNLLAPDQYLSIVVPGRMYAEAYRERGLHAKNLSRTLEDAGTLTSPLVPWNSCGSFMFGALAVSPAAYAPYAFINLICPVLAILYGFTGWKIVAAKR